MGLFLYLLFSYLIGCIMFGFIIGKMLGKIDIRAEGSGNVGARNAGRTIGKSGFLATFLGDAGKAAFVMLIGEYLGFPGVVQLLGFLAVIVGHVWPITLGFHGGKGISSFLGGLLMFNPVLLIPLIGVFLVSYPIFRSFTKAGLLTIVCTPIYFFVFDYEFYEITVITLITLIMIYAHSSNIKKWRVR